MTNKKGFTLTEILLAVMIVGLIGIALAALTTASSRESTIGNSKILLRNNLTAFLRQLRHDIRGATRILYVSGNITASSASTYPMLLLGYGVDVNGNPLGSADDAYYVAYCFSRGSAEVYPSGSYTDGTIERRRMTVANVPTNHTNVCTQTATTQTVLSYVKYLNDNSYTFKSPSIYALDRDSGILNFSGTSGVLRLRLIVELPGTKPVVNEAVEEIFLSPMGINR